jgi:hypothetical protein
MHVPIFQAHVHLEISLYEKMVETVFQYTSAYCVSILNKELVYVFRMPIIMKIGDTDVST